MYQKGIFIMEKSLKGVVIQCIPEECLSTAVTPATHDIIRMFCGLPIGGRKDPNAQ